jgi:pectate lyase
MKCFAAWLDRASARAALVSALALLPLFHSGSAAADTLLTDGFEDGNATGWSPVGGTWKICKPTSTASYEYCKTDSGAGVSLRGGLSWSDYVAQAAFRTQCGNASCGVSLHARVKDASHYYELELSSTSTGAKRWAILKNNGVAWTNLKSGANTMSAGKY